MSTTDGDAASRLDDAIADVLHQRAPRAGNGGAVPAPTTDDDWNVDDPDDPHDQEPYSLPEIVAATSDSAPAEAHTAPTIAPAAPVAPGPPTARVATPTAPEEPVGTAPATSWSDHMVPIQTAQPAAGLRTPGRRPRVRRVTRVLRHIDPWSTFKLALLFSIVAYLVSLTSGVLLWRVADRTGTLDNVERWFTQFGWETFELDGGEIFRNAWVIGLFGAVAMTGGIVLLATLFNLVSDIVGGVRVTVLEEEVVERTISSTRRYVVRRPPTAGEAASDWDVDESEPSAERADGSADADEPAVPSDWSIDDEDDDTDDDTEDDDEQEAADVAAHERSRNADESADPTVETAAVQSDGDARPAG